MTPEQKATDLVDRFRVVLMSEDTDCGYEIVCTLIAIQHAEIVCEEIREVLSVVRADKREDGYWHEVKQELKRM